MTRGAPEGGGEKAVATSRLRMTGGCGATYEKTIGTGTLSKDTAGVAAS